MPESYVPKMKTELVRLVELFDYGGDEKNFGFDIPSIQRDFSWLPGVEGDETKNDSSHRLIQDLLDFHYRDPEGHDTYFLGTVILFEQEGFERLQIMDGQQRLTALVSLMSMMRYILLNSGEELIKVHLPNGRTSEQSAADWAEDLRVAFLEYGGQPSITPKSSADRRSIEELLSLKGWMDPKEPGHLTPGAGIWNSRVEARGSPLYLTSRHFLDRLTEEADRNQDGVICNEELGQLLQFYYTLRYRVVVNRTTTEDIGLAYRMFVTANTRGMPLNNFDIFRGLIIARAYQLGFDTTLAAELENNLEVTSVVLDGHYGVYEGDAKFRQEKKSGLIDTIMAASASVRVGRRIAEKNVSSHFENEIGRMMTFEEIEELVDFTKQYAVNWDNLPRKRNPNHTNFSPEYRIHRRMQRLGLKQHLPFVVLMQVKEWRPSEIEKFLWQIECFVMRVQVAAGMSTAKHLYGLMRFAKEIYEGIGSDEVINNLSGHLRDSCARINPGGWSQLRERRVRRAKTAFVLLHAVLPGQRNHDPGPQVHSAPKARGLLPPYEYEHRVQGWLYNNKEMGFPGIYTERIGNWFLVEGTLKELNKVDTYAPHVKIHEFKDRGSSETRRALANHEEGWDAADIDDRVKGLMVKCEAKYPTSFEKP